MEAQGRLGAGAASRRTRRAGGQPRPDREGGRAVVGRCLEADTVTVDSLLSLVPVGARQVAELPEPYEQQGRSRRLADRQQ